METTFYEVVGPDAGMQMEGGLQRGPGPLYTGLPSRRSACDRCRGHKVRCLRDDGDQERCDRCSRADVQCVTTPVFRMRSYSREDGKSTVTTTTTMGERPRKRARQHDSVPEPMLQQQVLFEQPHGAQQWGSILSDSDLHNQMAPYDHEQQHRSSPDQAPADLVPMQNIDLSHVLVDSNGMSAFPMHAEHTQPMVHHESPQDWTAPHFQGHTSSFTGSTPNMNSSQVWEDEPTLRYEVVYPDSMRQPSEQLRSAVSSPDSIPQQAPLAINPVPQAPPGPPPPPPLQNENTPLSSSSRHRRRRRRTDAGHGGPVGLGLGCVLPLEDVSAATTVWGSTSNKDEMETYTQMLSQINFKLLGQLSRINDGPPKVTLETILSPIDDSGSNTTRADAILSDTREFLDVLELVAGGLLFPTSSTASPSSGSLDFARGLHKRQESYAPSVASSIDSSSSGYSSPTSEPTPSSAPAASTSIANEHRLDTAALLLILTCYVHLLRLYVAVFAQLVGFLRDISAMENPSLCPFPGISFSNFPLQSGNLQLVIFIQIVTSLLHRCDRLLGLPQEFRIHSRGGGYKGLLSDQEFSGVIRIVLGKEELGQPMNGKGGAKVLRRYIKTAKHLLRENIAP